MKLHADPQTALNTFTACGDGYVEVNRQRYTSALLVRPDEPVAPWEVTDFDALGADDFERLAAGAPQIVLLGTGARQRFPDRRLTLPLLRARIGVEVMDTRAACRTYNILMAEGRRVLAALLMR